MSNIKDIVPEKDWRKVKIQDYPATATPQNVPSEHFLNGMSEAIKLLDSSIVSIENLQGATIITLGNGLCIQYVLLNYQDNLNTAIGPLYRGEGKRWDFPKSFSTSPVIFATPNTNSLLGVQTYNHSVNSITYRPYRENSNTNVTCIMSIVAIGFR